MSHAFPEQRVFQRKHDFHTLVEIAGHPVGAAEIDLFLAAVGEMENATVLEKAAHNAAHANTVTNPAHAGTESAHAPDDQIDIHSRLRGAIQPHDDVLVEQGIHLCDDVSR